MDESACEEAGLRVRYDAIGNTFARWNGTDPAATVVGTGSHIDAIPNAGKYDGVVGCWRSRGDPNARALRISSEAFD